jgi:hypothetical protein
MTDDTLVTTRLALHALAEGVISPLRVQATGNEIALQARPGGFGTPDLPGGGWAGISGTDVIVVNADGSERRTAITSPRRAAQWVGLDGAQVLPDKRLEVHAGAARVLADAFLLGDDALRALTAGAASGDDPSEIHLWPEHFDIAVEMGPDGGRATYGVSPGDDLHEEPYAYVTAWSPPPDAGAKFWNATAFTGAERPAQADDVEELVEFWVEARRRLTAGDGA